MQPTTISANRHEIKNAIQIPGDTTEVTFTASLIIWKHFNVFSDFKVVVVKC